MTCGEHINDPAVDKYMRPEGVRKKKMKHVIRNKKLMDDNNASNDLLACLLVKETNILSIAMTSSLITKISTSSVKSNSMPLNVVLFSAALS